MYFISRSSSDNWKKYLTQLNIPPPQIKLMLLQNAVRPIDDLRIVETLDQFQSITTGYGRASSLKYRTYYDLLINTCVTHDRTKKANIAKRGHIYQTSSTLTMMDLTTRYPMRLQYEMHTWV